MGTQAPRRGRIIFLNGTSSSGKSSIAEALLQVLDEPWFHFPVDAINAMRSKNRTAELDQAGLDAVLARTRAGFHRAVAGMAEAGNDVIIDYVLSEPWRLIDCLRVLEGFEVIFVGVRCAPGELARRERARGDREPGQAAAQQERVHEHGIYDVECNTTTTSPTECAVRIKEFVTGPQRPAAFDRLRALLDDQRPVPSPYGQQLAPEVLLCHLRSVIRRSQRPAMPWPCCRRRGARRPSSPGLSTWA